MLGESLLTTTAFSLTQLNYRLKMVKTLYSSKELEALTASD